MLLCIINCKSILRGCWHRWSGETGKITVLSLYTKLKGIFAIVAVAKSLQSCLTLSDPMDYSLPGSSIHGIFQARVLEWGAIAFSEKGF